MQHKTEHGARRRITLAHATLRSALAEAQRLQLVSINAATLVKVPKPTARADHAARRGSGDDVSEGGRRASPRRAVLASRSRAASGSAKRPACDWEDIDLTTGEVRIRQQLQRVGKRLVLQELKTDEEPAHARAPAGLYRGARAHRTRQLKERLKAGPRWVDTGLVFTTLRPTRQRSARSAPACIRGTCSGRYTRLLEAAKLPRVPLPRSPAQRRQPADCRRRRARRGVDAARSLRAARDGGPLHAPGEADRRQSGARTWMRFFG